ncbi:MAG: hypothetical protein WCG31_11855 [Deltaproteobacteria bacterium]
MEYFWLAERILGQLCRQITEQQREEIIAEAVCAAWCVREPLSYRLMRNCVKWAAWKHLSYKYSDFPVLVPLHTSWSAVVPPPELPSQADVINLSDYRRMPTSTKKLVLHKQAN